MGRLHNRSHQTPARRHLRTHGTPSEARLWTLLRNRQIGGYRFQRQFGIGPYILDLYCRSARLGIEVDGGVHGRPEQAAYDADRTAALARLGVRVLRVANRDVRNAPDAVVQSIAEALCT